MVTEIANWDEVDDDEFDEEEDEFDEEYEGLSPEEIRQKKQEERETLLKENKERYERFYN